MDDIAGLLEAVALCELWLRMGSAVCPDVDFTDVDFTADPQQVARALRAEVERRMAAAGVVAPVRINAALEEIKT